MLTRYRLVNAEALRAVSFQGRTYVLANLTDADGDVLYGNTHVLEKVEAADPKPTRKARTRKAS